MKKFIYKYLFIALVIIVMFLPSRKAYAGSVSVKVPSFKVTLNGVEVDNNYNKYPLITYKDITYFPMTYYDSRFLGLETKWDNNEGLKIEKT